MGRRGQQKVLLFPNRGEQAKEEDAVELRAFALGIFSL